jgi:hypothetical protein
MDFEELHFWSISNLIFNGCKIQESKKTNNGVRRNPFFKISSADQKEECVAQIELCNYDCIKSMVNKYQSEWFGVHFHGAVHFMYSCTNDENGKWQIDDFFFRERSLKSQYGSI